MPQINVPIVAPPYPSLDGIELDSNTVSIHDGYIDEAQYLVKRPGLSNEYSLGSGLPVDGIAEWEGLSLVVAVSNQICSTIDTAGTITDISTATGSFLQLRERPSFAFTKVGAVEYMAVANGGQIYVSTDGGNLQVISDATAPVNVTHLAFVNDRLVANEVGSDIVRFSDFEDPFTWDTLSFFRAQAESDAIVALYKSWNEIALFGATTIEFWYVTGDSSVPYANMEGTSLNVGLASKNGVTYDPETSTWYFIDSQRNINMLTNHGFKSISEPIDGLLEQITDASDTRLDIINFGSHKFIVCTFPTDEVTYVYDTLTGFWVQWGRYDTAEGKYFEYLARSASWITRTGKTLIGSDLNDGLIYEFDKNAYQDGTEIIRTSLLSGWIDCDALVSKNWKVLSYRMKRQPSEGYSYNLRFRKNYLDAFVQDRSISMSDSSTQGIVQRQQGLGQARMIQFEMYFTGNSPFIVGKFQLLYTLNRV